MAVQFWGGIGQPGRAIWMVSSYRFLPVNAGKGSTSANRCRQVLLIRGSVSRLRSPMVTHHPGGSLMYVCLARLVI